MTDYTGTARSEQPLVETFGASDEGRAEKAWAKRLGDKCLGCPAMQLLTCGKSAQAIGDGADPEKLRAAIEEVREERGLNVAPGGNATG